MAELRQSGEIEVPFHGKSSVAWHSGGTTMKKIAIIGAGLMGHGIGLDFARGGYETWYFNTRKETSDRAMRRARLALDRFVEGGLMSTDEADRAFRRIHPSTDLRESADKADYVSESVLESLSLKREIFAELERVCGPETILTSNSSSYMITSIVEDNLEHPGRCCVAHYFQPPHFLPLVEVVKGKMTETSVLDRTCELLSSVGKKPVLLSKEVPGHAGNRIQYGMRQEIHRLIDEGVCTHEMIDDIIMYGFGRRTANTGWFIRQDLIGIDFLHNAAKDRGNKPWGPIKELFDAGHLGMKSGKGFYDWPDNGESIHRKQDMELLRLLKIERDEEEA
jgi:3-hydroxybutyryl-CoA dehydrogenase